VLPDDLQRLAQPVLSHRMILTSEAAMQGRTVEQVVATIVAVVGVPDSGSGPVGG